MSKTRPAERSGNYFRFQVGGKPQGKARPRVTRSGRAYTPKKTERAEMGVAWSARDAGVRPIDGPVALEIVAIYEVPKSVSQRKRQAMLGEFRPVKPDADNVLKLVADALNGIAYGDDNQIVSTAVWKIYGAESRVIITVRSATSADLPREAEVERAGLAVRSLADVPRASDPVQVELFGGGA